MKNTRKLLGFTAVIAAIGLLSLAGCSTPDDDGGSTGGGRRTLVSIEVNLPTGFRYTPGSDLDLSGITVTAAYSDGSTEKVTDTSKLKIEGYDKDGTGEQAITVSYGGKSVTVKITDSAGSGVEPSDYGISLSQTEAYTFASAIGGYAAPTPLTVTVTNTGSQATGALAVALSGTGAGSFTLSKSSIDGIAVSENDTFTVAPKTGLAAGAYTATVTVSGGNGIAGKSFSVSFTVIDASTVYVITGSGTSFTAVKNSQTIGTANQPIQAVIDAIKTNAAGQACVIQFGDGATTLNIGTAFANFSGTGWGLITLTGKISSAVEFNADTNSGTIAIGNAVSVTSGADITNTTDAVGVPISHNSTGALTITGGTLSTPKGNAVYNRSSGSVTITGGTLSMIGTTYPTIYNNSTGAVHISGGTVQSTTNTAVYNASTGAVSISGGTVQSTTGYAVWNASTGKITVSGTAKVTSANTTSSQGTIFLAAPTADNTAVRLEISGGTIENTSTAAGVNAIRNNSTGAVSISGGTVSARGGGNAVWNASAGTVNITGGTVQQVGDTSGFWSVCNYSTGAVHISGGTVSATTGVAVYNNSTGKITVSNNAKITSANTAAAEGTIVIANSGTDTAARLEITGGTVENSSTGNAIYNASSGAANISGGTISAATGYSVFMNNSSAMLTLGGSPAITGRIRPSAAGKLTAASGFTPSGTYILDYASYAANNIAVAGGASHLASFTLYNQTTWFLAASGNNIVITATAPVPDYGITLSESGTYTFTAATIGYAAPSSRTVTVTNSGKQATGALTIALSGTSSGSFTLSKSSITGIAVSGTDTFTVTPKTGLALGTYTATVTVSGTSITSKTFNVSFTVNPTPVYGITLSESGTYTFTAATAGYAAQTPLTVTVTNSGNQATGTLTVALSKSPNSSFTLSKSSINSIAVSGTDTFTVVPKTGLAAGTYTENVLVLTYGVQAVFEVSFTVNNTPDAVINIAEIAGVTAPVYGATPVTAITANEQYSGTVSWSPAAAAASRTVKIDMYDYGVFGNGDGWNGNGALRIVKNGTQLATDIKVQTTAANNNPSGQRDTNTYSFDVTAGDVVQVYWVAGTAQNENSFIMYYADTPPSPAFSAGTTGWSGTGSLLHRVGTTTTSGTVNGTLQGTADGASLGSFTASGGFAAATTYTATITLTAKTGYTLQGVTENFFKVTGATATNSANSGVITAVFPRTAARTYGITLSQTSDYTFTSATAGYAAQTALTVTVTNTGNQATGNLTAALTGTNASSFTLSKNSITSMAASGTDTFTIVPKTGLAVGTYTATITVSGGANITSKTFNVSFTVLLRPWTAVSDSKFGTSTIYGIAYGNNIFVAVGDNGKMATSTDGTTWTAVSDSTFGTNRIYAIAYGNNMFVAVGAVGKMATSTNGTTWTAVSDSAFGTVDYANTIYAIAYGNNRFVAGGIAGKMATSTNGTTWTAISDSKFGSNSISGIAYGNTFVAVGSDGKMAVTYGTDCTAVSNSTFGTDYIYGIAYGNSMFVAGGDKGKMATSTNGTTWTAVSDSTFGTNRIYAIAYGNNMFFAGGDNGKMATSTNGTTWTAVSDSTFGTSRINGIAYGNYTFVAVGDNGKIVYTTVK